MNPQYRFILNTKPYDAEIEYLETEDGLPCIDTGIVPTADTRVECGFSFTATEAYMGLFGNYINESRNVFRLIQQSTPAGFFGNPNARAATSTVINKAVAVGGWQTASISKTKCIVDNVQVTPTLTQGEENTKRLALLKNRLTDEVTGTRARMSWCKIYEDEVLVRDFIPVRVGSVGYMYDRVSGTLYGNAGAGSFVLGADIIHPAKPLWSESLGLTFSKESGQEFFRRILDGNLTFVGPDYDNIMAQPFDTKFVVEIQKSDDNGVSWTHYWSGSFYKTDCAFDEGEKTVVVKPSVIDAYGAILAGLDKEYNLIELAPEIGKIKYDKRPLIQIYSPGESVVSCLLSGMWWEQECDVVVNTTVLEQTYKFGQLITRNVYRLSGDIDVTVLSWGGDWSFSQDQESGPGGDFWVTELIRNSDGARWYDETAAGAPQPELPITLQPDSGTPATGFVTVSETTFSIYGRMLLDVDTILGQNTSEIPANDIVENNRNYHRVIPFTDASGIILSDRLTATPTRWGLYQPGQYYQRPYVIGMSEIYPIGRSEWNNISLWFAFSTLNMAYDQAGRKAYVLNDAYPLYSVISVLLKEIAPDVTHGDGVDYSAFLYGAAVASGIKQGNWRPLISPKSNVLNGNYDMPASKAPITLRQILDMLRDCFRCYWFVDDQNRFRIEHIEYFRNGGQYSGSQIVGIDLTAMENTRNGKSWAFGLSQFKFDKPEMPERYEFAWMDDVTERFEGWPLEIISGYVEKGRVEKITISNFTSDLDYMLLNPGACSQDGFALFGAFPQSGNGQYQWYIPYDSESVYQLQNGFMAFSNLQEYYFYDMPASKFKRNGVTLTAYGIKRLKTQDVSFPSMADPDPIELIRTDIGNGNISKMSVNLSSRNVKATLNYDTE